MRDVRDDPNQTLASLMPFIDVSSTAGIDETAWAALEFRALDGVGWHGGRIRKRSVRLQRVECHDFDKSRCRTRSVAASL